MSTTTRLREVLKSEANESASRPRLCRRQSCGAPAVTSMSYDYANSEVLVKGLAPKHPTLYELCTTHTETLTVPRGWRITVDASTFVKPRSAQHQVASGQGVDQTAAG